MPWRRAWQPTPVFLPGESHGQTSQVGFSSEDHKKSDMTWAPKSLQMVTAVMKLKDTCSLEEKTNLDSILKSRDITLQTKVYLVKAMVFPMVMYRCELDCEES